jgi:deoxyribose-phosphate aldolase
MVINLAALKEQNRSYLEEEIGAVSPACKQKRIVLKLIIESGILTEKEIIDCCELYKAFDIDF